jgi:integrase
MWVVKSWKDTMPAERNYLDLDKFRFIFNRYKTAKSSGTQIIDIPADSPLRSAIMLYIRHHPVPKLTKAKTEFRFLVKHDGTPMQTVNSMTRLLNKVFGRRIGSSMLRHSYLSSKYGKVMEEMKEDAAMMAHDGPTQQTYIRGGGPFLDVIELV